MAAIAQDLIDNVPIHARLMDFTSRTIIVIQFVTVGIAFLVALVVKPFIVTEEHELWAAFFGQFFLQLMSVVMIFVIIMNVVTAVAHTESVRPPIIAVKSIGCYVITSMISVTVGILCALVIPPDTTFDSSAADPVVYHPIDALYSLLINMFPQRLVGIFVSQQKFEVIFGATEAVINGTTMKSSHSTIKEEISFDINTMGLIALSLFFGLALRKNHPNLALPPAKRHPILHTLIVVTERIIFCIHSILPLGLVSLVVKMLAQSHNWSLLIYMGEFIAVVICGLLIHIVLILPLLCVLLAGKNPKPLMKRFYFDVLHSTLLCNSRASTLEMCQEKFNEAGISIQIWGLILPMGFKLSLNGTALYEAAAAVFITRLQNVSLGFWQLAVLGLTVGVMSIGVCEIRSRGAVITVFVLKSVGLQYFYYIALLAVCEILLYPLYDAVNVLGNCLGAIVVYQRSKSRLLPRPGVVTVQVPMEEIAD